MDLEPAARRLGQLVAAVPDDRLEAPTPCPGYAVGDLVDHVGGLALGLARAARKTSTVDGPPPSGDAARLPTDWRERIPLDLVSLAIAWRDPVAWTGTTAAGGFESPAEIVGLVTLDELVVHGWDLARASGVDYGGDAASLAAVHEFLCRVPLSSPDATGDGLEAFGPPVDVPPGAPLVDRIVGLVGRDPRWAPAG